MDYSNALSVFDRGLCFLQRMGFYGPKVGMETSKLAGDSLLLIYDSQKAGRLIEVSYLGAQRGHPAAIAVFIVASGGERFSLEDWLVANKSASSIQFSTLNSPELPEDDFIEQFCHDFEKVCDQWPHEILSGEVWKGVPIDWKGYR